MKLKDFNTEDNLVIIGIAGQGKSIFLRHLCADELRNGQYIPLFVELRRIQKNQTLKERLFIDFQNLGLTVDDKLFDVLAESGKVLLLLDAFDEVPEDEKPRILTEIQDLALSKENLRIIVTSRPNNNIEMSPHFRVVNLDDLRGGEYKKVIGKLTIDSTMATNLISHVESHSAHLKGLLCTPLMVTLLVISYKSYHQLPTQLSDFYDSLFQALLQRHDGSKPGYKRERSCKLDDIQYRHVFETICIIAKRSGEYSFRHKDIYDFTKQALLDNKFAENPDNFLSDIIRITCLILRDGEEYRFIHKSVQEYYSASFLARKPEVWIKEFYHKLIGRKSSYRWENEVAFLSEIDKYRYSKFFLLPYLLLLVDGNEDTLLEKNKDNALKNVYSRMLSVKLGFSMAGDTIRIGLFRLGHDEFLSFGLPVIFHGIVDWFFKFDYSPMKDLIKSLKDIAPSEEPIFGKVYDLTVKDLVDKGFMKKELESFVIKITDKIFDLGLKTLQSIKEAEHNDIISDLI